MGAYIIIGIIWMGIYAIIQVFKNDKSEFELALLLIVNLFVWPLGMVMMLISTINKNRKAT